MGSGVYEYTFTSLVPGQYTLSVRAVNSGAPGPEVSKTRNVSAIKAPIAPKNLSVTHKGGEVTLNWEPPESVSAPTGYQVTISDWDHAVELGKDAVTYTFTGLADGSYTLMVRAVNQAGPGKESTVRCTV